MDLCAPVIFDFQRHYKVGEQKKERIKRVFLLYLYILIISILIKQVDILRVLKREKIGNNKLIKVISKLFGLKN